MHYCSGFDLEYIQFAPAEYNTLSIAYYIEENCMTQPCKTITDQFTKLQKIGSGLTSTVFKALHPQLGQVCLKVIDPKFYAKPIGKLLIDNQIQILNSLNHKHLLKILQAQQNPNQNLIITQFCEGGNLYELTKKCKKFTQQQTLIIVEAIVSGLASLYAQNIIHRDLKPENIFFKKGEPIIADFGFAVHLDNKDLNKVNAGSPLYMAPEALKDLEFSIGSQVFAIGVIIYEMLYGKTPWTAESQKKLLENMLLVKPTFELTNKKFQALIKKCIEPNKQKRAKFNQIETFFNQWKQEYFSQTQIFQDLSNAIKAKQPSKSISKPIVISKDAKIVKLPSKEKDKKKTKVFKLNFKPAAEKENSLNQSFSLMKTNRIVSSKSTYQNRSVIIEADGAKTKRSSKLQKSNQDLVAVLKRLDPDQMRFLPISMIEKFKFILASYMKIIESKEPIQPKDIPKGLINDLMLSEVAKSKNEKDLCRSIEGYIGRMYRLAKNYKIQAAFIKDIQVISRRVETFCA